LGGAQHRPTRIFIYFGRARAAARPILLTGLHIKRSLSFMINFEARHLPIKFTDARPLLPSAQDPVRKLPKEICAVSRINPQFPLDVITIVDTLGTWYWN
jgi:hypothetical protein